MNNEELKNTSVATQCIQGGYIPGNAECRTMPIVQSTTFKYDSADELADVFDLKQGTPMYTRLGNPSLSWLEEKIALMEGGVGALTTLFWAGGDAVFDHQYHARWSGMCWALSNLYGGTHTLLGSVLPRMGIEVTFIEPTLSLEEMKTYIRPETRCIFSEMLGNPALDVLDLDKMSTLAKWADVPLIVDNTFPTPYLCRPIEFGANIVVHSATKYLDGHATCVGGVLVDGGNFNWDNGKYPELTTPDLDYHGRPRYGFGHHNTLFERAVRQRVTGGDITHRPDIRHRRASPGSVTTKPRSSSATSTASSQSKSVTGSRPTAASTSCAYACRSPSSPSRV